MALALVESIPMPDIPADFESFWTLYPRREAKKDAMKAWGQMTFAHQPMAIEALVGWRRVWAHRETHYIPLAASWLRGERYFDELPPSVKVTAAAHQEFAPAAPVQKGELPEHVKALIAKLKAQKA